MQKKKYIYMQDIAKIYETAEVIPVKSQSIYGINE